MKLLKNTLFKNTIIILITSMAIRILGLLNKIILTRSLGNEGISLYSISLPTIMLFLSLSSFSLNNAMIKMSAKYKSKKIIKIGITYSIISSSFSALILLLILKPLSLVLLKQPNSYYPILLSIPLFYLTAISSILRGYLTGMEKISTTSIANLIEQIFRILFVMMFFHFINSSNIIIYVNASIIAMSFGELMSIFYSFKKIIKIKNNDDINKKTISNGLLEIAIPSTLNSLVSNITFFLEPIIYTFVLSKLSIESNTILFKYSEVTAYSLPLITIFSFIPMSISTLSMPKLSKENSIKIDDYINKLIIICLIISFYISSILFNFSENIMYLLYKTNNGSILVKKYVWFFIPFYFISPFTTIFLSTNQSKIPFLISTISHFIKLLLILLLPFISDDSLIISYIISYNIIFISYYILLKNKYKFKINIKDIFFLILITFNVNLIIYLFKTLNFNFIFITIISFLFYIILISFIFKRHYI